jgi:fatty acid desaturase
MKNSQLEPQEIEWPTWGVCVVIWGGWFALVGAYATLPGWISTPLMVVLLAWHMSFQHELTHGHPTRNASINRLIGLVPLAVWYPFDTYKVNHLKHHDDTHLTEPGVDTESNYVADEDAARMGAVGLWLKTSQRTVLGRFVLGPALMIFELILSTVRSAMRGDSALLKVWVVHLPLLALLLWGLEKYTAISAWYYCFAMAYPALGLAMLRSLYEHRPGVLPAHRTVINEAALPWRLLYLNNNYHVVHHAYPDVPWYKIPALYAADRDGYRARNAGFVVPGYGWLIRHFAWKPVDSAILGEAQQTARRAPSP